ALDAEELSAERLLGFRAAAAPEAAEQQPQGVSQGDFPRAPGQASRRGVLIVWFRPSGCRGLPRLHPAHPSTLVSACQSVSLSCRWSPCRPRRGKRPLPARVSCYWEASFGAGRREPLALHRLTALGKPESTHQYDPVGRRVESGLGSSSAVPLAAT